MTYQNCEGILLRAIPYRDYDSILTLLTPQGKMNVVKKGKQTSACPLTHVEITYFVGKSDLYNCRSLTILNPHLSLRKNLKTLEAGCEMAKAASSISVSNQDCKEIFDQLLQSFSLLSKSNEPENLISKFYLFLLESEGLLPASVPQTHPEIKYMFYKLINL